MFEMKLKKIGLLVLSLLFVVSAFTTKVEAAGNTVRDKGIEMKTIELFDFNLGTYDAERSNIPATRTEGGGTYTAYYPNSFTYTDGTKYSVKIDVTYVGENQYKAAGDESVDSGSVRGIGLASDKAVELGAFGLNYNVTFTFYSKNTFADEDKARVYAGIVFEDPDQANYIFPGADTKKIYYKNATNKVTDTFPVAGEHNLIDFYNITSEGVVHKDKDDTAFLSWPNFDDGKFAVLVNNESSFTYTVQGKQDNLKILVDLIKVRAPYKIEYYYEKEGAYPAKPDEATDLTYVDIYETPVVKVTKKDKTPKKDGYQLDKTKNDKWELAVNPDGTTVLKVYFNLPYTILYNANGGEGEMKKDVYVGADEKMPSKEEWTFTREGYEFLGFKFENEGDILNGSVDYRDVLLKEEDREVELFAQWNPLDYTIVYDPNGGEGEMPNDEYTGEDETMPSKEEWTFTRKGYEFIGFKLENEGEIQNGSQEYRSTLIPDEDRKITLYAQWKP